MVHLVPHWYVSCFLTDHLSKTCNFESTQRISLNKRNIFCTFSIITIYMWVPVSSTGKVSDDCIAMISALNPIVWCYVWYYAWYYVWHDVWLNIVINKFVWLLSEIMVTWIFRHYYIVHEMHSMWFMWKVTKDINYKFFVKSEFSS